MTKSEKAWVILCGIALAAWFWIDAFMTIMERTGA
jgi:hypothetical protein